MEERAYADIQPEREPDPFEAPIPRRGQRVPWWRKPRNKITAVVIAAMTIGAGVWATLGTRGDSTAGTASPAPSPTAIYLQGTLSLPFGSTFSPNAQDPEPGRTAGPKIGDPCTMLGGYNDITQGAAVVIANGTGRTLATAPLSAGSVSADSGNSAQCEFTFTADVPPGQGTYTVTISHRGTQVFTEAQIQEPIQLALGNGN